eukprot:2469338-Amphidinium_carterae.1
MSEVRQFRAEEEYYRLHEQLFEHQGGLQEQMIANVQQQANNLETRGFQRAVQDNAEVVIAQRLNHEASVYQQFRISSIETSTSETKSTCSSFVLGMKST